MNLNPPSRLQLCTMSSLKLSCSLIRGIDKPLNVLFMALGPISIHPKTPTLLFRSLISLSGNYTALKVVSLERSIDVQILLMSYETVGKLLDMLFKIAHWTTWLQLYLYLQSTQTQSKTHMWAKLKVSRLPRFSPVLCYLYLVHLWVLKWYFLYTNIFDIVSVSQACGWMFLLMMTFTAFLIRAIRPCFTQAAFLKTKYWSHYIDIERKMFDDTCKEHAKSFAKVCIQQYFENISGEMHSYHRHHSSGSGSDDEDEDKKKSDEEKLLGIRAQDDMNKVLWNWHTCKPALALRKDNIDEMNGKLNGKANGAANGFVNGHTQEEAKKEWAVYYSKVWRALRDKEKLELALL